MATVMTQNPMANTGSRMNRSQRVSLGLGGYYAVLIGPFDAKCCGAGPKGITSPLLVKVDVLIAPPRVIGLAALIWDTVSAVPTWRQSGRNRTRRASPGHCATCRAMRPVGMLALADSRSVDSRSAGNACVPRDPAMSPSVDPVSQGMLTAAHALQGVTDLGALVR